MRNKYNLFGGEICLHYVVRMHDLNNKFDKWDVIVSVSLF